MEQDGTGSDRVSEYDESVISELLRVQNKVEENKEKQIEISRRE